MATKAIITDYGRMQIAQALAGDYKIPVKYIAYGNGGGAPYEPTAAQETLKDPNWRTQILELIQKEVTQGAWTYYYAKLPATVSNLTIREIGLVDTEGKLLIVASVPDTELVKSRGGVLQDLTMKFGVTTSIGDVLIVEAPTVVPAYTNDSLGLIQGRKEDGFIYRKSDDDRGYGAVYGWDNVFKKESEEPQYVDSIVVYANNTVHYYKDSNDQEHIIWSVTDDMLTIGDGSNHLHFNTNDTNTDFTDHITVTTPQGNKALAYLTDMPYSGITHYAFNAGAVKSNGDPEYAYIKDYTFGVRKGTRYTDANITHELTENITASISAEDETEYNVFIEYDPVAGGYAIRYLDNAMYRQPQFPKEAKAGDYWLQTLEPLQAYWIVEKSDGTLDRIPCTAVYAFRLTRGEYGLQYAEYEGEIIAHQEEKTLDLPSQYEIIQPDNFHWQVLGTGTMDPTGLATYKIGTVSDGLVAKMPDYAWNGYNVNMRTLSADAHRQLPDPTGNADKLLLSNGDYAYWSSIEALIADRIMGNMAQTQYRELA